LSPRMGPEALDRATPESPDAGGARDDLPRGVVRVALGLFLGLAGVSHFVAPDGFRAQVPPWMPAPDLVIWVSGVVEVVLGLALVLAPVRYRPLVGWLTALFFVAVFPGNVSQWVTGTDAFGLDSDRARGLRLLLQPALVVAALWATRAWSTWRTRGRPDAGGAVRPRARR
jgi:uncharacterized membrane protein